MYKLPVVDFTAAGSARVPSRYSTCKKKTVNSTRKEHALGVLIAGICFPILRTAIATGGGMLSLRILLEKQLE